MKPKLLHILLIAAVLLSAYTLPGCGTTPQQRVQQLENAVDFYVTQSQAADADIAALEASLVELRGIRDDAGRLGDSPTLQKTLEAVVYVQDRLKVAKRIKQEADSVVESLNKQIEDVLEDGSVDIPEELDLYANTITVTSSALPPPWNMAGYGLATVLTAIAGFSRRRQKKSETALKEVVTGTEDLMRATADRVPKGIQTDILKRTQTSETRRLVDDILVKTKG